DQHPGPELPLGAQEVAAGLPLERFGSLTGIPGLVHAVTTRSGGSSRGAFASLNLGRGCGDRLADVRANRARVAAELGASSLTTPRQVHGCDVVEVDAAAEPPDTGCDALITTVPGRLVGVLGADCPGVLLVAPARRVLAVVHAGWRGIEAGIVPRAVAELEARHGVSPAELLAGIGPGISAPRYEVSAEVGERIALAVSADARDVVLRSGRPGHAHADLKAAIEAQLATAGVPRDAIERHPACTYDDARFFSHRRDQGITGRHALVAGWM
nr:polyphenol oxidase family protein [Planctomycetota bacterium]